MFIDKQNYNLTASGLVSVKSDDMECEIKFESNRVVLNIISINSKNLRSFFKLSDLSYKEEKSSESKSYNRGQK